MDAQGCTYAIVAASQIRILASCNPHVPCNPYLDPGHYCSPHCPLLQLCPHPDGTLRLVGGSIRASGRLEVSYNGAWGTVCDDGWDVASATVACRQLGYMSGRPMYLDSVDTVHAPGMGPILMDDVRCRGYERRLVDCVFDSWGVHDCSHSEDAGVWCSFEQVANSPPPPAPLPPDVNWMQRTPPRHPPPPRPPPPSPPPPPPPRSSLPPPVVIVVIPQQSGAGE